MTDDVLMVRMQSQSRLPDLHGRHVHLCTRCWRYVRCDDICTWDGESTAAGIPSCHPTLCDPCRLIVEGYQEGGSGI